MAEQTFKITLERQLALLSWMIIVYSILAGIYLYFYGFTLRPIYIYIILIVFLLDICPALLVHLQYLRENKHGILSINRELKRFIYTSPSANFNYNFEDISLLQLVSSYGGGGWYSFAEYRYFRIVFKDKSVVNITCLMVEDIKNTLPMLLRLEPQKKAKPVAFISR